VAHLILYYLLAWIVLGVLAYSLRSRRRHRRDDHHDGGGA